MLKINLKLGLIFIIIVLQCLSQAAIIPNANLSYHNNESAWPEFKPNGLLLLRGVKENSSSFLHEAMIFKTISNAIRLMPLQTRNTLNDFNQKMYGDGVEHKFPPFMERVIQRIQTYFSIYKYTDTATSSSNQQSTPLTADNTNITTTTTTTNGSLNFDDYNEIDVNLTSTNIVNNSNKNKTKTTIKPLTMKPTKTSTKRTTLPLATTTPTPATTILDYNVENTTADEENEFIEIKRNH